MQARILFGRVKPEHAAAGPTYLHVLVGGLLPFFGHGVWRRLCEVTSEAEQDSGYTDTGGGIGEDLGVLAGR